MLKNIKIDTHVQTEDIIISTSLKYITFKEVSQKQYEEAIARDSREHHAQLKWFDKLHLSVNWEYIWQAVHNTLSINETKTLIWKQIHLNFYTQYMYNIWHKEENECPLCKKIPESVYHIILECQFTNELWKQIEPFLKKLHPANVTDDEKAFGIAQKNETVGVLLRN